MQRAEAVLGAVELTPGSSGSDFHVPRLGGMGGYGAARRRRGGNREARAAVRISGDRLAQRMAGNSVTATRAATWAKHNGAVERFARAVYRREFACGADITDPDVLRGAAVDAGLDGDELAAAVQRALSITNQMHDLSDGEVDLLLAIGGPAKVSPYGVHQRVGVGDRGERERDEHHHGVLHREGTKSTAVPD